MRREKSRMVWFEGERPRVENIESMERLPKRNLI